MMKAEIISIGTEILLGHIVNTNTAFLSKMLSHIGIDVFYHTAVGDNPKRLGETIKSSLNRSDIVITTGGLGPTVDDITLEAIAGITAKRLVLKKDILQRIEKTFKIRGYKMPEEAARQAYIPEGAIPIRNNLGTASGLIVRCNNKIIIALPGPPRELQPMTESYVMPYLRKTRDASYIIKSRVLELTGLPESHINARVKDLLSMSGDTTVGIYAHVGQVDLKITCKERNEKMADKKIKNVEREIRKRFGKFVFGADGESLQEIAGGLLARKKKTLAVAESCSGGYISNLITNVPGSSKYFKLGVVAYANESKIKLLGISKHLIKNTGAVSKETAKSMAQNVRVLADSDIGIGVTGIAGPGGGTKKKPVGTVHIAIADKKSAQVKRFVFMGAREEIKLQTAEQAINALRLYLI